MNKSVNIFSFLLILLSIIINSCSNELEEINALTKSADLPDIEVKNLETSYNSDGKTKVKLSTPSALKYVKNSKNYTEFPKGLNLLFYSQTGKKNSELTADYGVYEEGKKFAKVQKNVILTNTSGSKLETEELFFDEKNEKIYSVKNVKITEKSGFTIEGAGGFESNFDFTVYKFIDVSGIIIQDDDEFLPDDETGNNNKPIKKQK